MTCTFVYLFFFIIILCKWLVLKTTIHRYVCEKCPSWRNALKYYYIVWTHDQHYLSESYSLLNFSKFIYWMGQYKWRRKVSNWIRTINSVFTIGIGQLEVLYLGYFCIFFSFTFYAINKKTHFSDIFFCFYSNFSFGRQEPIDKRQKWHQQLLCHNRPWQGEVPDLD